MAINCYVDIEPLLQSLGRIDATLKQRNEIEKEKLDILKAYLKIDCPGQWKGREAISFNTDGFIGFCGWADTQNGQPIYRAWRRWCLECMINKYDED